MENGNILNEIQAHPELNSLLKDLLNSKLRSEMINEFIQNHDQHDYLSTKEAYLLSLVEVENFDMNSYKINDAINCQNIFLKKFAIFSSIDISVTSILSSIA